MSYSIHNHSRGYDILLSEGILGGLTLSGAPYALRHKEMSEKQEYADYRIGHRILMVVQFIPGIGLLAAIIERIVVYEVLYLIKRQMNLKYLSLSGIRSQIPRQVKIQWNQKLKHRATHWQPQIRLILN